MLDALKATLLALVLVIATLIAVIAGPDEHRDGLACVTGEPAQNPIERGPDGQVVIMPVMHEFDTIEEAERWICLAVPQAVVLPGWQVSGISAHRSLSLDVMEGGVRWLTIDYMNSELGVRVSLDTPCACDVDVAGAPQAIEIRGEQGTFWLPSDLPRFIAQWGEGDDAVMAYGGLPVHGNFEHDILPLLETVH